MTSLQTKGEPAFIARARRILSGDIHLADYLCVPDAVEIVITNETTRIVEAKGFKISDEFVARM